MRRLCGRGMLSRAGHQKPDRTASGTGTATPSLESFHNAQTGKYKLTICTNLPCALSSAAQAAAYLQQKLGVGFGETTADGLFTLKEGECFGACGDAPVVLVNNKRMCSWMRKAVEGENPLPPFGEKEIRALLEWLVG